MDEGHQKPDYQLEYERPAEFQRSLRSVYGLAPVFGRDLAFLTEKT